jgi:hypothetical protein
MGWHSEDDDGRLQHTIRQLKDRPRLSKGSSESEDVFVSPKGQAVFSLATSRCVQKWGGMDPELVWLSKMSDVDSRMQARERGSLDMYAENLCRQQR